MHFLKNPIPVRLNKSVVCVPVDREGKKLVVSGGIDLARPDTVWAALPEDMKILSESGEEIKPSGRFLVTVESIDPYHLVTDQPT
jgi:hypothetical protein